MAKYSNFTFYFPIFQNSIFKVQSIRLGVKYSPQSVTLPAVTLPPVRNFAAFFQENMFRATVRNFATRPYLCRFLPVICFFILAGRTYF